jgi:hypothetical protein
MPITVKHLKVSTVPDAGDDTLVEPSDWNADHQLTGLGTMAEQDANAVAITGGTISGVTLPATDITGTLGVPNGGTGATTLTGYVKGTGTAPLSASATIPNTDITGLGTASTRDAGTANGVATLDAGGKVPVSELPAAVLGALSYQGTWDASTNTPTLTSSVGTKGYYYVVNVAGNTNLNGITDWLVGDWAVYNGTVWQKVDNTETVTSVNGQIGAVVLSTTDIGEGTNLYYTDARARTAISAGTGISYDNTTGVVTNAAPDQTVVLTDGTAIDVTGTYPNFTINNTAPDQIVALTGAGTTTVSGTYPNFTITSADSKVGDVVGPASATDNAIARFDTTTGKLIQNSTVTIDDNGNVSNVNSVSFDTTPATLPTTEGSMYWDVDKGSVAVVMQGADVVQDIGESQYIYIQASANITKNQVVMFTGAIGGSGIPTGAPATGVTDGTYIMGIAAEAITSGTSGFVQTFGILKPVNTTGFATGTVLWYDPTVAGGLTATKPVAPNIKVQMAAVTAGNSAGGALLVRVTAGSELGGTDSNVLFSTLSGGNLIAYDATNGYWKNINLTDGTAISITEAAGGAITITNTAPDQVVALTGAGTTSISGTYPNFTISSDDQFDGTVTSVDLTAGTGISVSGGPITSSGSITVTNTAPDQVVSLTGAGTTSISGTYPNFTVTSNDQFTGTVTAVTGTAPVVSSGGNTPAISMAAATGSVDGYLTSTDWTTFNSKAPAVTYTTNYIPYGQGTTTPNQNANFTFDGTTQTAPIQRASNGIIVNSQSISASYTIAATDNAMSVGPVTIASGQTVTVSSGSRWVVL